MKIKRFRRYKLKYTYIGVLLISVMSAVPVDASTTVYGDGPATAVTGGLSINSNKNDGYNTGSFDESILGFGSSEEVKTESSNEKTDNKTEEVFKQAEEEFKQYQDKLVHPKKGKDHREGRPFNKADKLYNKSNFLEMRKGMEALFDTTVTSAGGSGKLYTLNNFGSIREFDDVPYRRALIQDNEFDMAPYTAQLKELASKSFKDITGKEWYAAQIPSAVYYGLTGGYPDGTFKGNNSVSRAEFASMLANYENEKYTLGNSTPQFKNKWYSEAVGVLDKGSIKLYNLSESQINKGMTRGEIAVLISRAYFEGDFNKALDKINNGSYNKNMFKDTKSKSDTIIVDISVEKGGDAAIARYNELCKANKIPRDILAGVIVMNEKGIIKGDDLGNSNWNKPVTRAEAIVILNNLSQIH
ncbi:MAG: S-layer homology domain-containing protein [Clostridiales bacterium]|nr:S-layer homology domain-containing protein [Clostridiales bacterium]